MSPASLPADPGDPRRPRLEIALVNNMPDAALHATERQFSSLLAEAACGAFEVSLTLYALPGVPRGDLARAGMQGRYAGVDALKALGADAVIVTGSEPRAPDLRDEPYWRELAGLVDWARTSTRASLWSCLAAHAAVLHMDGVERRRLPAKASGVFVCERQADSPLTSGFGRIVRNPHSRYNALPAEALAAKGYQILTRSAQVGVDIFARQEESLCVFLQGHPEYEPDTLMREYRRDLGRFARGEQDLPQGPAGYFDPDTERAFQALAAGAQRGAQAAFLEACDEIIAAFRPTACWRRPAVSLYRNWLGLVAAAKSGEGSAPPLAVLDAALSS